MTTTLVRAAAAVVVVIVASHPELAAQGAEPTSVYQVPVQCGSGSTSINVHNTSSEPATLTAQGIPLAFGFEPTPPGEKLGTALGPGWALLFGCDEILTLQGTGPSGLGDVTIEAARDLDVWVVYTDRVPGGGVGATRLERIQPIHKTIGCNGPQCEGKARE